MSLQTCAKEKNNALQHIDEVLQDARIICHSHWKNHNEIFYEYLFPKNGRDGLVLQDAKQSHIVIDKQNRKLLLVDTLPDTAAEK